VSSELSYLVSQIED